MDRSFLSKPEVVVASKKFVCIRLISYEDESEKAFISKVVRGEVANTSFALLTPEGEMAMRGRGPGRGPKDLFADSAAMAKGMDELASKYPVKKTDGIPSLPITLNPKVGLAVAAGDNQPMILVWTKDPQKQKDLEAKVAKLAWNPTFEGRFVFATSNGELPKLQGQTIEEGILMIEPDIFGIGGKVVQRVASQEVDQKLAHAMKQTLSSHWVIPKNRRELAVLGLKEGIWYETGIPVSGKGEAADRERYKNQLDSRKK